MSHVKPISTREVPDEVHAPAANPTIYRELGDETDLRSAYRIPEEFLKGTHAVGVHEPDVTPLIVFINSRSGGRVGPELSRVLYRAIGQTQVYDLSKDRPDQVLRALDANLKAQEQSHNAFAPNMRKLRILAAGGDGTIAWIMGTLDDLELSHSLPIAIMPLGTGNDLSRSFGWGPSFLKSWIKDHKSIYHTLKAIATAEEIKLDLWTIKMTVTPPPSKISYIQQIPHSLKEIPSPDGPSSGVTHLYGRFWNYLSIGLDAKTAYGFHHLRETHPCLASGRIVNQMWYGLCGCKSGWFGYSRPLSDKVALEIWDGQKWEPKEFPKSIRALVLLNLQSYGGGRNLWGNGGKNFKPGSFNDQLLEVVGFKSGWSTMPVMTGLSSAERIAQASGVRFTLKSKIPHPADKHSHAYMQIDGEPWCQFIPTQENEAPLVVEVKFGGVSSMLMNANQKSAKSVKSTRQQQEMVTIQAPPTSS